MYRLKTVLLLVGLLAILASCEDDWLAVEPLDQVTEASFFTDPEHFTTYANRFYPSTGGTSSWGDAHTDILVYATTAPSRLAGDITINSGPGYGYANVRRANYLVEQVESWEGDIADIEQEAGEAYYFRAFFHWQLVQNFGDIHWVDEVLDMDSEQLYAPRDSRTTVVQNILDDLDRAVDHLKEDPGDRYSRLSKWNAHLLKSRIALYEGTWQKYHAGTSFGDSAADADALLQESVESSREIMDSGYYEIYTTGDPENDYYNNRNRRDYASHPEAMWWTKMDIDQDINAGRKLFYLAYPDNKGFTKHLIDQYLDVNGDPIAVSTLYQGDDTIEDEVVDRDPRMDQSIFTQDDPLYIYEDGSVDHYDTMFPRLFQDVSHSNSTGYHIRKQYNAHRVYHHTQHEETPTMNDRYAEVLLNYAEAKAELGTLTQADLDESINLLRDRVDMPHLDMNNIPNDPDWAYPDLSPLINEIRRERLVELSAENFRMDDLLRWRAMDYLEGERAIGAMSDQFQNDPGLPTTPDGHLDVFQNLYPNGYQFDEERDYLWPIPESEIRKNPDIGQNPGWDQ